MPTKNLSAQINEMPIKSGEAYKSARRLTLGVEAAEPAPPLKAGTEQAFFSEKSIVSFAPGVSAADRQDILNTTLFAQMAANAIPQEGDEMLAWCSRFLEVLGQTGWIITGKDIQTYEAKGSLIEVENVIIDILTTAFGTNYIGIIKKTLEAIKGLSDSSKRLKVFERNVNKVSKGCFQIALATQEAGVVSLHVGSFILDTTHTVQSMLFFKAESNSTKLRYLSKNAIFNADIYGGIRETIKKRLGDKLITNIAEIELA
jgi:hypothetical protein